jgi:hypothetical protein
MEKDWWRLAGCLFVGRGVYSSREVDICFLLQSLFWSLWFWFFLFSAIPSVWIGSDFQFNPLICLFEMVDLVWGFYFLVLLGGSANVRPLLNTIKFPLRVGHWGLGPVI